MQSLHAATQAAERGSGLVSPSMRYPGDNRVAGVLGGAGLGRHRLRVVGPTDRRASEGVFCIAPARVSRKYRVPFEEKKWNACETREASVS